MWTNQQANRQGIGKIAIPLFLWRGWGCAVKPSLQVKTINKNFCFVGSNPGIGRE